MENKDTAIETTITRKSENEEIEIILDNKHLKDLLQLPNYQLLESISLRKTGIVTLEDFPYCPKLKRLELSDNHIKDGLHHLSKLTNLVYLNLSRNKISKLEDLKPLVSLGNLQVLNLIGCAITRMPDYRASVFELIPSLKSLDKYDIYGHSFKYNDNDKEVNESIEETKTNSKKEHTSDENEMKPRFGPPPISGKLFKLNESLEDTLDPIGPSHTIISYNSVTFHSNSNSSQLQTGNTDPMKLHARSHAPVAEQEKETSESLPDIPKSPVRFDEKEEEKKRKRSLQNLLTANFSDDSDEDDEYDPTDDEEEEDLSEEEDFEEVSSSEETSESEKKKRKESPTDDHLPKKRRK